MKQLTSWLTSFPLKEFIAEAAPRDGTTLSQFAKA